MRAVVALVALAMAGAAQAQAVSGAESGSVAGAQAGAQSGASASNTINVSTPISAPVSVPVSIAATQPLADTTTRIVQSGTSRIESAPALVVTGPASGPCTGVSGGAGLSWMGGGFGFNAASIDHNCTLREGVRVLLTMLPVLSGEDQAAARAMAMDMVRAMHSSAISAAQAAK